jgi:hypothetical protein
MGTHHSQRSLLRSKVRKTRTTAADTNYIGGEEFAYPVGVDLMKKQAQIEPVLKQPRAEVEIGNQRTKQS